MADMTRMDTMEKKIIIKGRTMFKIRFENKNRDTAVPEYKAAIPTADKEKRKVAK